jgi:hypothetical protein
VSLPSARPALPSPLPNPRARLALALHCHCSCWQPGPGTPSCRTPKCPATATPLPHHTTPTPAPSFLRSTGGVSRQLASRSEVVQFVGQQAAKAMSAAAAGVDRQAAPSASAQEDQAPLGDAAGHEGGEEAPEAVPAP